MSIFKGTATALITPFVDGQVDYESLGKLVDLQLSNGISALIVNGTTGEPTTMTHDERTGVSEFVISRVNKRIPVILGAGSNNTYTAVEYAVEAEKLGANAVLAVTPYYNKATQTGLIAHYQAIADNVTIPVIMYNVPGRTGVNLLPSTVAKLADYKNIAAVKEASGNILQMMEIYKLCKDKIDLYSGDDALVYPCLAVGGKGVISVASNIIPKYMSEMTDAFFAGDMTKSRDMQLDAMELIDALFCEVNPIPAKTAAFLMGLIKSPYMRLPLTQMEKVSQLKNAMKNFGLQ